jgi:hypothetical protein
MKPKRKPFWPSQLHYGFSAIHDKLLLVDGTHGRVSPKSEAAKLMPVKQKAHSLVSFLTPHKLTLTIHLVCSTIAGSLC